MRTHSSPGLLEDDPVSPHYDLVSVPHVRGESPLISLECQHNTLALLYSSGSMRVVDATDDTEILTAAVRNPHKVFVDPSGSYVLAAALDGDVHFYSVNEEGCSCRLSLPKQSNGSLCVAESILWQQQRQQQRQHHGGKEAVAVVIGTQTGGVLLELSFTLAKGQVKGSCVGTMVLPGFISPLLPVVSLAGEAVADSGHYIFFASARSQLYRIIVKHQCGGEPAAATTLLAALQGETAAVTTKLVPPHDEGGAALSSGRGGLMLFRPRQSTRAQSYCWASTAGVLHGVFNNYVGCSSAAAPSSTHPSDLDAFSESDSSSSSPSPSPWESDSLLSLSSSSLTASSAGRTQAYALLPAEQPRFVSLTAFHMVLVYERRCIVLNHPAGLPLPSASCDDVLHRVRFDPFRDTMHMKPLRGVVRDEEARRTYIYNDDSVWELQIEQEHRNQWRLFFQCAMNAEESAVMRKRFFDAAYNLCRFNRHQRNVVQLLRGKFYLERGAVQSAVGILSDCDAVEDAWAVLETAHQCKLLPSMAKKRLELLCGGKDAPPMIDDSTHVQLACMVVLVVAETLEGSAEGSEAQLKDFLESVVRWCPTLVAEEGLFTLVLRLLEEHGGDHDGAADSLVLYWARIMGKSYFVVSYCVAHGKWKEAVDALTSRSHGGGEDAAALEMWYEFAPVLMQHCPVAFVTAVLRVVSRETRNGQSPSIRVERLVPALMQYKPSMNEEGAGVGEEEEDQANVLLEQYVLHFGCASPAVHHLYIARLAKAKDEERLEEVLTTSLFYDPHTALRLCQQQAGSGASSCLSACAMLYKKLNLFDDAILAMLEGSAHSSSGGWALPPAVASALQAMRNHADWKRLWHVVLHYVANQRELSPGAALGIVEASHGAVQLSDVLRLAHVSDHSAVHEFKDAITRSLDDYATAIAALHTQQEQTCRTTEAVKLELRELKHQYGFVSPKQRCPLCRKSLMMRRSDEPFIVYPNCRHVVHEACAMRRLEEMGGLEAFLTDEVVLPHSLDRVTDTRGLAQVDCVMCGEAAIVEIDIPLCEDDPSWGVH